MPNSPSEINYLAGALFVIAYTHPLIPDKQEVGSLPLLEGPEPGLILASACQPMKLPVATTFSTLTNTPMYLTMGIDEGIPSQLALSVGTIAAGSTVSAASSEGNNWPMTSTNGNSPTEFKNQKSPSQAALEGSSDHMTKEVSTASPAKSTSESTADFTPHPPAFQETFAGLESGLDLAVGSFNFFVNNLGTQELTGSKTHITIAPDITSTMAPVTVDPSAASASLSFSSATTMSTQELNKWLDSLGDEEVESTFAASQATSGEPLENTFEYGISLDDFTGPKIQIENNDDMQTGDSDSISRKDHHNFSDIEMSTNDKFGTDQSPPEGPFDCNTNSDMSLDEDSEQAMEVESILEYPQSIPRQVCVLFA